MTDRREIADYDGSEPLELPEEERKRQEQASKEPKSERAKEIEKARKAKGGGCCG